MKVNYRLGVVGLVFFSALAQAQDAPNTTPDSCGPPPPSSSTCGPPSVATVPCMEKSLEQTKEYAVCKLNAIKSRALTMQPSLGAAGAVAQGASGVDGGQK